MIQLVHERKTSERKEDEMSIVDYETAGILAIENLNTKIVDLELPATFAYMFYGNNVRYYVNGVEYTSIVYNDENGLFFLYDFHSLKPDTQDGMICTYVKGFDIVNVVRK